MQSCVELSLYPFTENYKSVIKQAVEKLHTLEGIEVTTHATCSVLVGEYEAVMRAVTEVVAWSHDNYGRCVFVAKILPGYVPS